MATPTPQENDFLMQSTHDNLEPQDQGCRGCFRSLSFFSSQRHHVANNDVDRVHLLPQRPVESERESWVVRQVKKLREVSELVAGPKWKNFLRKIGAYFGNNINKRKGVQYSSFDYTLNFDDGNHDHDHNGVNYGFTSRFAPPVQHHNKKARSTT